MEINQGIEKSFDSAFFGVTNVSGVLENYVMKYKNVPFIDHGKKGTRVVIFQSEKEALNFLNKWVKQIFWQGEYWQSCHSQIKTRTNIDVDFSATIKILPQYGGETSRFDLPENKKMFKDFAQELIKNGIVTIEKIKM